jgi:hypothetical protein
MRISISFTLLAATMIILVAARFPFSNKSVVELIGKANLYNQMFPQEKVYLHLDRPSYWTNDTIWFKAYLKNQPVADCNLHVELISSNGTIICRKLYWAQNGLAYGDIALMDSLSSGNYQIRAYTDWMRNFDDQWYFKQNLIVWNLKEQKAEEYIRQLKERDIDFQFLPEGGTFIEGIKTKMAFKATDQNGVGLDVRGVVSDDLGNTVTEFQSTFNGMGSFFIEPEKGRKYSAILTVTGNKTLKMELPVPAEEGAHISVNPFPSDSVHVVIHALSSPTTANPSGTFYLVAQSNGIVFWNSEIQTTNGTSSFSIGKDKLPTGIVEFTLFDQNLIPRCERLVFVNHHDFVAIDVEPNKKKYAKRELVNLNVMAFDKANQPYLTNLSLSVFNTDNQLTREEYPNNILTQFLLCSELKGNIESPAYYLKDDSTSTLDALDNLMLTHGYRQFEWEAVVGDQYPTIVYQPESGIKIRGTVKTLLNEKPVPNAKVSLLFLKSGLGFNQTTCDSTGKFEFPEFFFNDTVSIMLDAKTTDSKKTLIDLDRNAFEFPAFEFVAKDYRYMDYSYSNDQKVDFSESFSEEELQKINRKWRLADTIMLNEIRVVKKIRKDEEVRPLRMYEKPDFSLELDIEDDELGTVLHHLEYKFPGVICKVRDENDSAYLNIDHQNGPPILVLDGVPLLDGLVPGDAMKLIYTIPQGKFDRIEVLKNGACYGNFEGGAVCFFTKKGAFTRTPNSIGMKGSTIIGYSVIRKFYSPKYGSTAQTAINNDFRNTLYWNPIVRTDSTGFATVSFYNCDQKGDVNIVVEGIASDGKLCRGVTTYKVE